ncbi:membrane hypothetical protein [Gammaproteobacteria bacterium]
MAHIISRKVVKFLRVCRYLTLAFFIAAVASMATYLQKKNEYDKAMQWGFANLLYRATRLVFLPTIFELSNSVIALGSGYQNLSGLVKSHHTYYALACFFSMATIIGLVCSLWPLIIRIPEILLERLRLKICKCNSSD